MARKRVPKRAYYGKTPESRARQLANLKPFQKSTSELAIDGTYAEDPAAFRMDCRILDNGKSYRECHEGWQEKLQQRLDGTDCLFSYVGLPRGHDKTGGAAWRSLYDLLYGPAGSETLYYAADQDQARIALDSLKRGVRQAKLQGLTLQKNEVRYKLKESCIRVETSDAATSFGKIPYRIYCDELHAWRNKSAIELWESLITSTGKIPGCRLIVTTNAGWDTTSVCYQVREVAKDDPAWFYFDAEGWLAKWVDPAWLGTMKRTLSPNAYARLIMNRWTEAEDAATTKEHVAACCCLPTRPSYEPKRGAVAVAVDMGLKHDLAAVAAVQRLGGGAYQLVEMQTWKGSREKPVQVAEVEEYLKWLRGRYPGCAILADPWQMAGSIQRLALEEFTFNPANIKRLTEVLLRVVNEERVHFWNGAGEKDQVDLGKELLGLVLVQMPYGERIDHRSGKTSDRSVVLGMALTALVPQEGEAPVELFTIGGSHDEDQVPLDGEWISVHNDAIWN